MKRKVEERHEKADCWYCIAGRTFGRHSDYLLSLGLAVSDWRCFRWRRQWNHQGILADWRALSDAHPDLLWVQNVRNYRHGLRHVWQPLRYRVRGKHCRSI